MASASNELLTVLDDYKLRLQLVKDQCQKTLKVMPHNLDEVKAQAKTFQPVVETTLRSYFEDFKIQLADMSPVVEESKINSLSDIYVWSAIFMFVSQICSVLGGSALGSAILRNFVTPFGSVFLCFAIIPYLAITQLDSFDTDDTRRVIVFAAVQSCAALMGFFLSDVSLRFWSPQMCVLPLCFTVVFPFFKSEWLVQSRANQLAACIGFASASYALLGMLLGSDSKEYWIWTMFLLAYGFVDLQMKLATLRTRTSIPLQQLLTCSMLLALNFFLASSFSSSVSTSKLSSPPVSSK